MGKCTRSVAFALSFALCAITSNMPAVAADSDDSVAYQENAFHDGVVGSPLHLPLHLRWSNAISGISYPIIAGKHVYVSTGTSLFGLDAFSGSVLWTQQAPYGWVPGEAYGNDRVYAQGSSSAGTFLYALDHSTGQVMWTSSLTTTGNYSFSTFPTSANGIVYTAAAGGVSTVFAIRAQDGEQLWAASVNGGMDTAPVVTLAGVYVSFACPQVYDLNPLTGSKIWHYDGGCQGGGGSIPVLSDGLLYIGDDQVNHQNADILYAGTGLLRAHFGESYPPAVYNHVAYVVTNNGTDLEAMHARDAGYIWSVPSPTNDSFGVPPLIVPSDGLIFEATLLGTLDAYRLDDGRQVMSIDLGSPLYFGSSMAIGENMLVVDTNAGLMAFSSR